MRFFSFGSGLLFGPPCISHLWQTIASTLWILDWLELYYAIIIYNTY